MSDNDESTRRDGEEEIMQSSKNRVDALCESGVFEMKFSAHVKGEAWHGMNG